jgi:hypothetical protein
MQQGSDLLNLKGWMLSKANTLHDYHTYNMGVHSCSAMSSRLYDVTHTGCTFVLQHYHLQRGCVGTCELGLYKTPTKVFPPQGVACGAGGGTADCRTTTSGAAPTSPPESWPKGGFAAYYARSIDELSGRTTGRLGYDRPDSAYAMIPSEGRQSWHYDTPSLQLVSASNDQTKTLISDYGPAGAAGARATPQHPPEPQDRSTGLRAGGSSK